MIAVRWELADGSTGEAVLGEGERWTLGRTPDADLGARSTVLDHPMVSRTALVVRDSGPGPVAFRGQRDNGVDVALVGVGGESRPIGVDEAVGLSAAAHRVLVTLHGDPLATVDVTFTERAPRVTDTPDPLGGLDV